MLEAVGALLALFAARRWSWALRAPVAAVCVGGVLLSGSRSAAIVLVVAVAYGLLRPGTSRAGTLGQVVVLVAGAVAVLTVDVSDLPQLSSLAGTGSLDHRLGALQSIDDLSGRPTVEALFGSGSGALSSLFTEGLLQTDGFTAVDNQLVTTFALAGVVGVTCLVGAVLVGLLLGDRTTRPAAVAAVLMFFSFDVLQWESSAVLAVVLLSLGVVQRTGAGADADEPGAVTALPDPRRPV
jgi:O-antigen ligase